MFILIYGRRRQGKSTLALRLACSLKPAVVVWDPNAQFGGYPILDQQEIEQWIKDQGAGIVVYRPNLQSMPEDFDWLAGLLRPWGRYAIIIDEAQFRLQGSGWAHPSLEDLVRRSPQDGPQEVAIIFTTHRLSDVSTDFRALVTDAFFFRTTLPHDREAIERHFGLKTAEIAGSLPVHHVVHWSLGPGGVEEVNVWSDPSVWLCRL